MKLVSGLAFCAIRILQRRKKERLDDNQTLKTNCSDAMFCICLSVEGQKTLLTSSCIAYFLRK